MAVIQESVETDLPIDQVFSYVADFANIEQWDPGVTRSIKQFRWTPSGRNRVRRRRRLWRKNHPDDLYGDGLPTE